MIEENFRVLLTKYIRIAADVFMNCVFKGNTVTDRDSAPYRTSISTQFTVRRKPKQGSILAFFQTRQPGKDVRKDTCPDKILLAPSNWNIIIILKYSQKLKVNNE